MLESLYGILILLIYTYEIGNQDGDVIDEDEIDLVTLITKVTLKKSEVQ